MRIPFLSETGARAGEFWLALRFLTRLPLGPEPIVAPGSLAAAGWAFPLIGALVGLIAGIAYWIALALSLPPFAAALIAIGASVAVTGGLHEDGLADMADGFGGGRDVTEKLAIMRDSRIGSFGVLALIFSVGLRMAAIAFIAWRGPVMAALIAAHAVGRGLLPLVMNYLPPAREDGLGAEAGRPGLAVALVSAAIAAVIALFALGPRLGIEALIAVAIVTALRAAFAYRHIGGHTGDVLGALEQGGEVVMLLAAAAWGP